MTSHFVNVCKKDLQTEHSLFTA